LGAALFVLSNFMQVPFNIMLKWILIGRRKEGIHVNDHVTTFVDNHYLKLWPVMEIFTTGNVIQNFIRKLYGLRFTNMVSAGDAMPLPSECDLLEIKNSFIGTRLTFDPTKNKRIENSTIGRSAHIDKDIMNQSLIDSGITTPSKFTKVKQVNSWMGNVLCICVIIFDLYLIDCILHSVFKNYGILVNVCITTHVIIWVNIGILSIVIRGVYSRHCPVQIRKGLLLCTLLSSQYTSMLYSASLFRNLEYILFGSFVDMSSIISNHAYDYPYLSIQNSVIDKYTHIVNHLYTNGDLKTASEVFRISGYVENGPKFLSGIH